MSRRLSRRAFALGIGATTALLKVPRAAIAFAQGPSVRSVSLTAGEATIATGSAQWATWAYNGAVPGPEIRLIRGDRVRITFRNLLHEPSTIHWHGLPVPPNMDGVPVLSQAAVAPGDSFVYEFDATASGTFFYHAHVGLQLDRGLYGPLIVEEPGENARLRVDREHVLMFDDRLPGSPEDALRTVNRGGMMSSGTPLYAEYLLNGRTASTFSVRAGERVRLRLINAGAATLFRVGIAGHSLTVTHADGQPVVPVDVATLVLGMGERYDAIVTANNPGRWPILVSEVGNPSTRTLGTLAYAGSERAIPPPIVWPVDLQSGKLLTYRDLDAVDRPQTSPASSTLVIPVVLGGGMGSMGGGTTWTINGQAYPSAAPFRVSQGARVQLQMTNQSMAAHPMHLHGHTGFVGVTAGRAFAKDTVVVNPMETLALTFVADNPGRWLFHCHNLYHMELGMARVIEYA